MDPERAALTASAIRQNINELNSVFRAEISPYLESDDDTLVRRFLQSALNYRIAADCLVYGFENLDLDSLQDEKINLPEITGLEEGDPTISGVRFSYGQDSLGNQQSPSFSRDGLHDIEESALNLEESLQGIIALLGQDALRFEEQEEND